MAEDAPANPFAGDRAAKDEEARRRQELKAAQARDAGEWFDVFEDIVFTGATSVASAHDDLERVNKNIREMLPAMKRVRREFMAHGLELSQEIEIEGPEPILDPKTFHMVGVDWGGVQEATLIWPDGSKLHFRGQPALVAFAFISWWTTFSLPYLRLQGKVEDESEGRRILPGTQEYMDYIKGKPRQRIKDLFRG